MIRRSGGEFSALRDEADQEFATGERDGGLLTNRRISRCLPVCWNNAQGECDDVLIVRDGWVTDTSLRTWCSRMRVAAFTRRTCCLRD